MALPRTLLHRDTELMQIPTNSSNRSPLQEVPRVPGKHPFPCIFRFSDNFVCFDANPPPKHESKWRALTMLNMFTEHSFPKTRGVLLWDQLV